MSARDRKVGSGGSPLASSLGDAFCPNAVQGPQAARAAFKKFLAANPAVQAQLGEGPYTLQALQDGSLQLASASGKSVNLNTQSSLGQQALGLYNSFGQLGLPRTPLVV